MSRRLPAKISLFNPFAKLGGWMGADAMAAGGIWGAAIAGVLTSGMGGPGAFLLAPLDPTRLTERAQALLAMPLASETPSEPDATSTDDAASSDDTPQAEAA